MSFAPRRGLWLHLDPCASVWCYPMRQICALLVHYRALGAVPLNPPMALESRFRSSGHSECGCLIANMPKDVAGLLGEFGIEARHAASRGWGALTKGLLIGEA
jgi:hypothetical protein